MANHPTKTTDTSTKRRALDGWDVDPHDYPDLAAWLSARLARQEQRLEPLWEMTVEQRIAAMRRGELSGQQLCRWASRFPHEVPTINGEFEFLAAFTPEVAEA